MPIPGVPEKAERCIFSTLRAESVVYFYIIRWSIFRRREWCLDHSIWLSNFDSMTISWNTVIFKFRWIFATDQRWIVAGTNLPYGVFVEVRWSVATKETRNNGLPQDDVHVWIVCLDKILRSSVPKIQRNLKNDRISWNDHRIKITQPNLKI